MSYVYYLFNQLIEHVTTNEQFVTVPMRAPCLSGRCIWRAGLVASTMLLLLLVTRYTHSVATVQGRTTKQPDPWMYMFLIQVRANIVCVSIYIYTQQTTTHDFTCSVCEFTSTAASIHVFPYVNSPESVNKFGVLTRVFREIMSFSHDDMYLYQF